MTYATVKLVRDEKRQRLVSILGGACAWCGETNKHLDFDHIDPTSKEHEIGELLLCSTDRLLLELEKCQLLCKSCHGRKTALDNGREPFPEHGTISRYSNQDCRCDKCREANKIYTREYRASRRIPT